MSSKNVPLFGVRRFARELIADVESISRDREEIRGVLDRIGGLTQLEREQELHRLSQEILEAKRAWEAEIVDLKLERESLLGEIQALKGAVVEMKELALLQEAGIYEYVHPLADAVAYRERLDRLGERVKEMNKSEGKAVTAAVGWSVNGSEAKGRVMVRDYSKLMLRAFNAEADSLVRGMKPYKLAAAIDRLEKVALTIQRLGKTMEIRVSDEYLRLRIAELELTADFIQKAADEKEQERLERVRIREEQKVQKEMERERAKLEKERQHYLNALEALIAKGDLQAIDRVKAQLSEVDAAISAVDYRVANIRAGYVYVISNIGSFGESLVKVGMTRRLQPMDRIRELSDASVPFNFDVHAIFFSKDAVGIEGAMHARLAEARVNLVNHRREFFRATPGEVRSILLELAGELLIFHDEPEAAEFRQSRRVLEDRASALLGANQPATTSA